MRKTRVRGKGLGLGPGLCGRLALGGARVWTGGVGCGDWRRREFGAWGWIFLLSLCDNDDASQEIPGRAQFQVGDALEEGETGSARALTLADVDLF